MYKVDKDGITTKYTRTVERVMQCISKDEIIFAEQFLVHEEFIAKFFPVSIGKGYETVR